MRNVSLRMCLASVFVLTLHQLAGACGYHRALGDSFTMLHPRSLDVAYALRDAADSGLFDQSQLVPGKDPFGYHRVVQRLQRLGNALPPGDGEETLTFSLLLVESALWSRFVAVPEGAVFTVHTDGARAGDLVVLTGGPVLGAIEAGRISLEEALQRNLIVIVSDNPADRFQLVSALRAFAAQRHAGP